MDAKMLLIALAAIGLILFLYPKGCGTWGTSLQAAPDKECGCLGIKYREPLVDGGNIACYGIVFQGGASPPKMSVPIEMQFSMAGAPSLNSEVMIQLTAKRLYPESIKYAEIPVNAHIELPEEFELVNGNLSFRGNISKTDTVTIIAKIKPTKKGYYEIKSVADFFDSGKTKKLFAEVTDSSLTSRASEQPIYIDNDPFTQSRVDE